ncbi:uncharacterized protein LOC123533789 isoform X2 [Mercenaria mercenaria]|nr:uncharacterized protein LOC123533789 isoform X2 [Mercenaria mercenaria]XP_045171596.1 uncharacterized protein LOC123533789 isoform X2 [Mercenaria mercenaria]XP_045171597.1 uncharacterized protein LOC123533789 isoform X2 [Mercenaria mercenaria]
MEAEYVGIYLGSAMLTKGTTGLGVIQKPLRDKYFAFRKSSDNKLGPEIGIRINPRGIILLFPGGHHGHPNDEFYEISSIHFIEAVQFVTVKQKDKKYYGAFLPIDEPEGNPSQDKLFVQIEKKFNHLNKISHPPMLACVMRRPTGVKAVDCHMFVIPVVEDALRIADMVHRFQERPDNPEFYHGRPPLDRLDYPPEPDVIPRNLGPPRERDPRNSGPRDSDDYAYLYKGRGLELKQEHFARGNEEDERRFEPNRSYERDFREDPQRYPPPMTGRPGSLELRERDRLAPRDFNRDPYVDRRPREFTTAGGKYVERDSFGSEHEFDNRVIHERQRSGGDRELDRFSGGMSSRNEFPDRRPGMSPRNEYPDRPNLPPRGDYNGQRDRGPGSFTGRYPDTSPDQRRGPPPWQGRGPGEEPRNYRGDEYSRPFRGDMPPRSPPLSSRGRISPRSPRSHSPPRGHSSPRAQSPEGDDQVYSASNLESRMEEVQGGKPVAKVPPNRHAGVRVLPSLPIPGAKNILKPVSPRTSDVPAKAEERPPSYNFNTKADSDEENPYDNAPDNRHLQRQNRPKSENSPLVHKRTDYIHASRVKSDDYGNGYGDNVGYSNKQQNKQWSYEDEKEKFLKTRDVGGGWSSANKSKSAHEGFSGPGPNDRGGRHMKDMEIEDMFSNMRTSNPGRNDLDFERSLGYLP